MKQWLPIFIVSVVVSQLVIADDCSSSIIYVDDSATSGGNNGTSWENAYVDLHDGLKAATAGDEVRIGQGVYRPGPPNSSREMTFNLPDGALVHGGYAGTGAVNPDANDPDRFETILSGDLNDNDGKPGSWFGYEENSYNVVTADGVGAGTEVRGVTVRAGNADDNDSQGTNGRGGGVFAGIGALTLTQCTIEDNQSWFSGGGIEAAALIATDCVIRRNRQLKHVGSGGGISAGAGSSFLNCVFQDNLAAIASAGGGLIFGGGTVDSCTFIENIAPEQGGALVTQGTTNISNTQFGSNSAGEEGGAIAVFGGTTTITECAFSTNSSGGGGAISAFGTTSVQIRDCDFEDQIASFGGAIHNFGTMVVMRSRFNGNHLFTSGFGGGGAIGNHGELDLVNCVFNGNSTNEIGGVLFNFGTFTAVNCRFTNNFGDGQGGVLHNAESATFINCTIAANHTRVGETTNDSGALHNRFDGQLTVNNCIVWGNETADGQTGETAQIWNEQGGTLIINNSCVEGWTGAYGGVENNGFDPLLVDEDNFRLTTGSPCIDHGNNAFLPNDELDVDVDGDTAEIIPLDLDLHNRLVNSVVDAGAYEFPKEPTGCPADIAPDGGNGTVDVDDLLLVINNWGNAGPEGDVTGNNIVDVDDLLAVINAWGACR
jgi:predicted outer membrane repeat protein